MVPDLQLNSVYKLVGLSKSLFISVIQIEKWNIENIYFMNNNVSEVYGFFKF